MIALYEATRASHHRDAADTIEDPTVVRSASRRPSIPKPVVAVATSQIADPGRAPERPVATPDAARLGNPSFVWRSGQERRLAIIERYLPLRGRRVLDLGCGLGEYVRGFERAGAEALGCDVAADRLVEGRRRGAHGLVAAAAEALPFRDGALDVVVLNEVIEHVADEAATLREVARVLAPEGRALIYAPNRLFPFETHGVFLGSRFVFGNIPFVNWLPRRLRDRLVPHARVYAAGDWAALLADAKLELVDHSYVYPGYDNIAARLPALGGLLRALCYRAEGSSRWRRFALSHLLVLRHRTAQAAS